MPLKRPPANSLARQKMVRYLSVGGSRRLAGSEARDRGATGQARLLLPLVALLLLFFILLGMWQERQTPADTGGVAATAPFAGG